MTTITLESMRPLPEWGTLWAQGADARSFLQGQLSFDMERLTPERIELAACSSPQGRVQAIVWLVERTDGIVLLLPQSMIEPTLARLRKYVLRAKVKLESGANRFTVLGRLDASLDAPPRTHRQDGGRSWIQWPGLRPRVLCIAETTDAPAAPPLGVEWRREDVGAGLPQVYPQTHEAFVAQMLNVDLLGGISFEKGCYTGQEIIARTHFRGAIKRRMLRFSADVAAPPPGTRLVTDNQHAGDVVEAVDVAQGCELLAVVNLAKVDAALEIESAPGRVLQRLDLPYEPLAPAGAQS